MIEIRQTEQLTQQEEEQVRALMEACADEFTLRCGHAAARSKRIFSGDEEGSLEAYIDEMLEQSFLLAEGGRTNRGIFVVLHGL